eukprot:COSAG02_NODE_46773_length_346_cov_0.829960_1_plen_34_part_01
MAIALVALAVLIIAWESMKVALLSWLTVRAMGCR